MVLNEEELLKKRMKEKATVRFMIEIYCHKKHRTGETGLCEMCRELAIYADTRVDRCPYMETKTFCSSCKTHCYKPVMRERIREVMRFSGPRMIIYSPKLAFRHILEEKRNK